MSTPKAQGENASSALVCGEIDGFTYLSIYLSIYLSTLHKRLRPFFTDAPKTRVTPGHLHSTLSVRRRVCHEICCRTTCCRTALSQALDKGIRGGHVASERRAGPCRVLGLAGGGVPGWPKAVTSATLGRQQSATAAPLRHPGGEGSPLGPRGQPQASGRASAAVGGRMGLLQTRAF
eukprot:scaffold72242_cov60-Phaeocystis_antarctica.AAC.9